MTELITVTFCDLFSIIVAGLTRQWICQICSHASGNEMVNYPIWLWKEKKLGAFWLLVQTS